MLSSASNHFNRGGLLRYPSLVPEGRDQPARRDNRTVSEKFAMWRGGHTQSMPIEVSRAFQRGLRAAAVQCARRERFASALHWLDRLKASRQRSREGKPLVPEMAIPGQPVLDLRRKLALLARPMT